jgi:hypothetical protein
MPTLTEVQVKFSDGSINTIPIDSLSTISKQELTRVATTSAGSSTPKTFVLLKWNDGWQEVLALEAETAELIRYYSINRIEDMGRLSLDVGADYPLLFIVKRKPREIQSVHIVGDSGTLSYGFKDEHEIHEGIYEAGGKIEYVKYDATADIEINQGVRTATPDLPKEVKAVLGQRGDSPAADQADPVKATDTDEKGARQEHAKLSGLLNVKGFASEIDVQDFVRFVREKQAHSEAS